MIVHPQPPIVIPATPDTAELRAAVRRDAAQRGINPEDVVIEALRAKYPGVSLEE